MFNFPAWTHSHSDTPSNLCFVLRIADPNSFGHSASSRDIELSLFPTILDFVQLFRLEIVWFEARSWQFRSDRLAAISVRFDLCCDIGGPTVEVDLANGR